MHALPFLSHSPATGPKDNAPTSPPPTKEEDSISQKIDSALERGAEAVRSGIESVEEAIDHMDHFLESQDANSHHAASPGHPSTTGTVLVALAVHELFLPVRLALTAALTPRVAARMKGTLVDLWMRKAGAGILRVKDVVKGALFPGSRRNPPPPPTRPT
ncbi:hypothetical protein BC830DRAFT_1145308 [Chytriomyces sp. MP71]|nr:hypothetical protein BC830DRAFT_1145308 [Chytriomyces sp. MP71]